MIDPTNTEPIPVHKPPLAKVLAMLAGVVIFVVVGVLVLKSVGLSTFTEEVPVVQPPEGTPAFSDEGQVTFADVMERVTRGEISREEAERIVSQLLSEASAD